MRTTYTAASSFHNKFQIIETANVIPLLGKTVTIQVKLRRNAACTTNFNVNISKSATIDAGQGATWVQISSKLVTNAVLPTGTGSSDWYTATLTVTIPNDGTANTLRIEIQEVSVQPSGAYWEMAEVQLEAGSVATPFRRNANSIQGELAACQRYFIASPTTGATYGMSGNVTNGAGYIAYAVFPVPMRVAPTTVTITNGGVTGGFSTTPASAGGITSFGFYEIRIANATTNGYFAGNYIANAEL
jgi:hypothetical protein